jgi:transcriptional regulator with XRE-family HTH domain
MPRNSSLTAVTTMTATEHPAAPSPKGKEEAKSRSVGEIMRHFRTLRGMTQLEVSKALNHSTPEWCGMIESGHRSLDINKAPRVAEVLKINAQDFSKHCLFEYAPALASALFGQEPDASTIRENHNPVAAKLLPGAYELAKKFQNLPALAQEVVVSLVNNLQTMVNGGSR